MASKDPYQILGVSRTATPDEVKRAYRRLAKEYHPDRNPGNKSAEQKFKEVQAAYEVLGDPQRRAQYDRFGAGGPTPEFHTWSTRESPFGGVSFDFDSLGDLTSLASEPLMAGRYPSPMYRPLVSALFALEYALFGLDAAGYQAVGAAAFCALLLALAVLGEQLGSRVGAPAARQLLPILVPVLFALAPSYYEIVPVPARIGDLLCAAFCASAVAAGLAGRAGLAAAACAADHGAARRARRPAAKTSNTASPSASKRPSTAPPAKSCSPDPTAPPSISQCTSPPACTTANASASRVRARPRRAAAAI